MRRGKVERLESDRDGKKRFYGKKEENEWSSVLRNWRKEVKESDHFKGFKTPINLTRPNRI